MVRFYTLALGLCLSTATLAQQTPSGDYALTTTGDTLRGLIRIKDEVTISLRSGPQAAEQTYTIEQLRGFASEGAFYVAAVWEQDGRPDAAFLRERVRGYVGLYQLPFEPADSAYLLRLPDQRYVRLYRKTAWNLLNRTFTECSDAQMALLLGSGRYVYQLPYFERIVLTYNRCVRPEQSVSVPKAPFRVEAGLLLGGMSSAWNVTWYRRDPFFDPNGTYPSYASLLPGAYLTIFPKKRLSVTIEMYYGAYKAERKVFVTNTSTVVTADRFNSYKFEESYLAFPLTLNATLLKGPVRWYARAGMLFVRGLSFRRWEAFNGSATNPTPRYESVFVEPGFGYGYLGGTGLEFKIGAQPLRVEVRATYHNVQDKLTNFATNRTTQAVLVVPLTR